jgi:hypothetical protein
MNKISLLIDSDKLDVIRRKMSFELNQDLTNDEVIEFVIDNVYNSFHKSVPKPRHDVSRKSIVEEINIGSTSGQAMKKLGISRSTFFRYKALEKKLLEESQ